MDLLRSAVAAATLLVGVVVGGCGGSASSPADGGDEEAPTPESSSSETVTLPDLEPVRPDETVVGRVTAGTRPTAVRGTSDDIVILYAQCAGAEEGEELALDVSLPRASPFEVACDGRLFRREIYTRAGLDFDVRARGADGSPWVSLVTTRAEAPRG